MLSHVRKILVLAAVAFAAVALLQSAPALAGKIAYVDFERAVSQSHEAQAAQKRLQQVYASKLAELQRQQEQLQKAVEDYEQKKLTEEVVPELQKSIKKGIDWANAQ